MVLRVGDAWWVGVLGNVLLMGSGVFGWSLLVARWIDLKKLLCIISLHRILKDRHNRAAGSRAG